MRLVAGFEGVEDGEGVIAAGFVHIDGMKAAGEGGIAFNMLAEFVQGGGADGLQFAAGEGGFEHIAGVQAAFSGAGADQGVHFVQEHNDFALGGGYFVDDGLEAFLEFAAEPGAGDEAAHIQGHHAAIAEGVGDVVVHDFDGEALGDGGFADAGVADEDGVVFGAAGQGLHGLADFGVAADYGVELAAAGELGEVDAVLFQGAVALFGVRVVHAVGAAQFLHGLIDHFLGEAEFLEQAGGVAGAFLGGGQEQVFHADELVFQAGRFLLGGLEHPLQAGGNENLLRAGDQLGGGFQGLVQAGFDGFGVDAEFVEDAAGQAVLEGDQGEQEVFHIPLGVLVAAHQFLGALDGLLGLAGKLFGAHYHRDHLRAGLRTGRDALPLPLPLPAAARRARSSSAVRAATSDSSSRMRSMSLRATSAPARLTPISSVKVLMRRRRSTSAME